MTQSATAVPAAPTAARWPVVVGTVGIVIGVLMIVDNVDDLLLPLAVDDSFWSRLLAPEMAEFIVRALPPKLWLVVSSLVGMALGGLLLVGSLRLRRRRRSGVRLCRLWAWLAIAALVVESVRIATWFGEFGRELKGLAGGGWEGGAYAGIVLALAALLAYPVFLLVWLARPDVEAELEGWQA